MSECLKKGYLLKCPQKGFPFKKWNSRWFVLYGNSRHGRVRLEYYDNEKAWQQEKGKRIVPLVNCVSIKPVWNKDYNHVIEIVTSDKTFYLAAGSKDEEKAWFKCLCKTIFGSANRNSIVQVLDRPEPLDLGYHSLDRSITDSNASDSPEIPAHSSPHFGSISSSRERLTTSQERLTTSQERLTTSQERLTNSRERLTNSREQLTGSQTGAGALGSFDGSTDVGHPPLRNVMSSASSELSSLISFESGFDDTASMASSLAEGTLSYPVTIRPTIGSQKAGMVGTYILQISPASMSLVDIPTNRSVADWPIRYVRRYGRGRTKFSFEASENCKTGKGVFTFNTLEGDAIFHQVDTYARKISSSNLADGNKDKRISLPPGGVDFKPLSAANKRKHHSEGKLSSVKHSEYEIRMDSMESLDGRLTDSANELSELGNTSSISLPHKGVLPSKSRAVSELGVIADDESMGKLSSESEEMIAGKENRGESELSVVIVNNDPALYEDNPKQSFGESLENLLENPASTDKDITAIRKMKQNDSEELSTDREPFTKTVEGLTSLMKTTLNHIEHENVQNTKELNDNTLNLDISDDMLTSEKKLSESNENIDKVFRKPPVPPKSNACIEDKVPSEERDNSAQEGSTDDISSRTSDELTAKERIRNAKRELIRLISNEMDKENDNGIIRKRKSRRSVNRNKSFEFPESEKQVEDKKQSGSFSAFDYREYGDRPFKTENGNRKLQRTRHLSVKKTIQHYEQIQKEAENAKQKTSFTLWRAKSLKSSQKPEMTQKTEK